MAWMYVWLIQLCTYIETLFTGLGEIYEHLAHPPTRFHKQIQPVGIVHRAVRPGEYHERMPLQEGRNEKLTWGR